MDVVVFDVDGVVADVRHRLHHLRAAPRDWSAFFAAAAGDPVLPQGRALAREFAATCEVVWLTGRPERLRRVTERWLARNGLPAGRLVMRRDGDRRPARVMKREALLRLRRGGHVALVVDDDPEVVAMARAEGLTARLADWVVREVTLCEAQERDGRT